MIKLTKKQIIDIAGDIEIGFNCYYHKRTGEILKTLNADRDLFYEDDLWEDIRNKIEENWGDYIMFTDMLSQDSFNIMIAFTDIVDDHIFKSKLLNILEKSKPFKNFKRLIDNSGEYRQRWFDFKSKSYIKLVKDQIYNYNLENDGFNLILKKDNIKLRPLKISDKKNLAVLADNKNVWDNLRDIIPHPYSEKDAENFINLTFEDNPVVIFGIEYEEELSGVIGLINQKDVYRKTAEIGYWIGEPYWGKGIATKAVKLITEYGFDTLDIIRIQTGVFEHNIASMKVLEKNGYKNDGIFRNSVIKNNKILDEYRYYILKN